jgi:hypothetical protein
MFWCQFALVVWSALPSNLKRRHEKKSRKKFQHYNVSRCLCTAHHTCIVIIYNRWLSLYFNIILALRFDKCAPIECLSCQYRELWTLCGVEKYRHAVFRYQYLNVAGSLSFMPVYRPSCNGWNGVGRKYFASRRRTESRETQSAVIVKLVLAAFETSNYISLHHKVQIVFT